MKSLKDSHGFSAVELIIVLLVLVVLAGAGYGYMKMKNNSATPAATTTTTTTSQTATVSVPAAPQVQKTSDLDTALNTVDSVNLDAGSSDSSQLGSQTNGF
ncbi:MAG TPA: prepilin-type N-terminal cleavage/methylation domain-containing protein [Candidatus Saccharimonadales bacterium]|nr:prepilin-type N-terminal cleavage/methylation domain-containing protein [Candidatus Saccharimonadales bacterium]